jgi:hypothetical protein
VQRTRREQFFNLFFDDHARYAAVNLRDAVNEDDGGIDRPLTQQVPDLGEIEVVIQKEIYVFDGNDARIAVIHLLAQFIGKKLVLDRLLKLLRIEHHSLDGVVQYLNMHSLKHRSYPSPTFGASHAYCR